MGARPHADGIDGIHAHMTNTLNTPIEAIERQMPMLITAYEFAETSAGDGEFRGGSGLVRAFALRDGTATASLLAERHAVRPRGTDGGKDGATGAHVLVKRGGAVSDLPAKTTRRDGARRRDHRAHGGRRRLRRPGASAIPRRASATAPTGSDAPSDRRRGARRRARAERSPARPNASRPITCRRTSSSCRATYAGELADLCARNPVPCPLLERLAPGAFEPRCAPGADLRTDLGRYRVWRDGALAEQPRDVRALWSDDLVAFLIGCSFTFDHALAHAGLTPRHYALDRNVPMYRTRVPLAAAGPAARRRWS